MATYLRVLFGGLLAVTLGFTWTVGQSGLEQTNRNLCDLWRSVAPLRYESCEFQYVLVTIWFLAALAGGLRLLFEGCRLIGCVINRKRRLLALWLLFGFFIIGTGATIYLIAREYGKIPWATTNQRLANDAPVIVQDDRKASDLAEVDRRRLAEYQASLKVPIIDEAIAILNHNAIFEQPIDDAGRLVDAVIPELKAGHRDELLNRLDALRQRFIANNQRIGALYVKTESIHDDIATILVQPYQNALIEGIYELSSALTKLENPAPANVEYWIKPALDKFKEGIHGVGRWRGTALFQLFDLHRKLTS